MVDFDRNEFLQHVAKHECRIILDAPGGVFRPDSEPPIFRHVEFRNPATGCRAFTLTTIPGRLIYAGDMGTYVFRREPDMFEFFRGCAENPRPEYWAQKVEAEGFNARVWRRSEDKFWKRLNEWIEEAVPESDWYAARIMRDEATDLHESGLYDQAYSTVMEFELDDGKKPLHFFAEISDKVYDYMFLWACHAIPWGIDMYDRAKAEMGKVVVVPVEASR